MKRILALVLVLISLVGFASAETIDISGMSSDELIALRDAINAEIVSRGIEKEVNVPAGTYTVGEDIPAGTYTIRTSALMISFYTYDANGNYDEMHMVQPSSPIGKLTVTDGQKIEIVGGYAIFAPYAGLSF